MYQVILKLSFFFSLLIFILGCNGEEVSGTLRTISCDSTTIFTYSNGVKTIFETSCGSTNSSCHSNAGKRAGYSLEGLNSSKNSINNDLEEFLCSIKHDGSCNPMPKNASKLSNSDINTIEQWICQGFQE